MELRELGLFGYMKKYKHENLVFCQDEEVDFKAIIAIHCTALGSATGGTRMWKYESETDAIEDALRLSRGMTYKYAAAGVNLGGAKGVIMADPKRPDRERIFRTYGRFIDRLNGAYITGEDVGTTLEDMEYIAMETKFIVTLPEYLGGSGAISPMTAYGVLQGMRAAAKEVFGSDDLDGKKVAVQGLGSVGSSAVEQLAAYGAKLVVTDIDEARISTIRKRFDVEVTKADEIFGVDCDIFCPCALGAIINDKSIAQLKCKIVCGSANNQLEDADRHGPMLEKRGILYVPDYIANAGGTVYDTDRLMVGGLVNKERAKEKVARNYERVQELIAISKRDGIPSYRAADVMAEERIAAVSAVKRHTNTWTI